MSWGGEPHSIAQNAIEWGIARRVSSDGGCSCSLAKAPHAGLRCRGSRREKRKHSRDKEERRYVAPKVSDLLRVCQSLCRHDCGVHNAGPHGEPDQTQVLEGIAARDQQENAQRRIDPQYHLQVVRQVVRLSRVPRPARRPNYDKAIDPDNKDHTDCRQRHAQVLQLTSFNHGFLLETRARITTSARSFDSPAGASNLIVSLVFLSAHPLRGTYVRPGAG